MTRRRGGRGGDGPRGGERGDERGEGSGDDGPGEGLPGSGAGQPAGERDHLPELPPEWAHFVVPDDPRELAAEAERIRAELRAERGEGLTPAGRRRERLRLSGPVITFTLVLVAAFASLMVVVLPSTQLAPRRAPLASPTVNAGEVRGLVPSGLLQDRRGRPVAPRAIRPAVLLLA